MSFCVFCRVIEFKDKDAARKAIETMHQYKIHDRYLVVNEVRTEIVLL